MTDTAWVANERLYDESAKRTARTTPRGTKAHARRTLEAYRKAGGKLLEEQPSSDEPNQEDAE